MKRMALAAMVLALAAVLPASADTVTLQATMDVGFAADTNSAGSYSNVGKYEYFNADLRWGERRFIMQWDLSGIPTGATVTDAQMKVFRAALTDNIPFSVYSLTTDWTEGYGMSNGSPGVGHSYSGANWYYRKIEGNDGISPGSPGDTNDALPWNAAGGDIDVASRIQFLGSTVNDPVTTFNFGMVATVTPIVQSWVSGSVANNGVQVRCDATSDPGVLAMRGRDAGYPDDGQDRPAPGVRAPQLVITYTAGPSLHPGDINGDGVVDLQDFGTLKENFGLTEGGVWATGDLNGDTAIDLQDFGILKDHFGHTNGDSPVTAVPEPATMSLLALAGLGLIRRNRK